MNSGKYIQQPDLLMWTMDRAPKHCSEGSRTPCWGLHSLIRMDGR
jgi:hypothetical protein